MHRVFDMIVLSLIGCIIIGLSFFTINPNDISSIQYSQSVIDIENLVNYRSTDKMLISICGGAHLSAYDGKCRIRVLEPVEENKKIILDTLKISDEKSVIFEPCQYTYYQISKAWSDFGRAISDLKMSNKDYLKTYGATTWDIDVIKNKVVVDVSWLNDTKKRNLSNLIENNYLLEFHFTIGQPIAE